MNPTGAIKVAGNAATTGIQQVEKLVAPIELTAAKATKEIPTDKFVRKPKSLGELTVDQLSERFGVRANKKLFGGYTLRTPTRSYELNDRFNEVSQVWTFNRKGKPTKRVVIIQERLKPNSKGHERRFEYVTKIDEKGYTTTETTEYKGESGKLQGKTRSKTVVPLKNIVDRQPGTAELYSEVITPGHTRNKYAARLNLKGNKKLTVVASPEWDCDGVRSTQYIKSNGNNIYIGDFCTILEEPGKKPKSWKDLISNALSNIPHAIK